MQDDQDEKSRIYNPSTPRLYLDDIFDDNLSFINTGEEFPNDICCRRVNLLQTLLNLIPRQPMPRMKPKPRRLSALREIFMLTFQTHLDVAFIPHVVNCYNLNLHDKLLPDLSAIDDPEDETTHCHCDHAHDSFFTHDHSSFSNAAERVLLRRLLRISFAVFRTDSRVSTAPFSSLSFISPNPPCVTPRT